MDKLVTNILETEHVAGLAAGLVTRDRAVWSKGYGWADIEQRIPMSTDTIMNVASVSKTITATAVMQLCERGDIGLDADINEYLPFEVWNPRYPKARITVRNLLTHRSSIKDGPAYGDSYVCGDPTINLWQWIRRYLVPGGEYYDPQENFYAWEPGHDGELAPESGSYTNVGFGLLGYLVEAVSGMSFEGYCRRHIFDPLGMACTGWSLASIDQTRHAIPYTYVPPLDSGESDEHDFNLARFPLAERPIERESYFAHCLYSFPNFPDGGLRTTINDLGKFLRATIGQGALAGARILQQATVRDMLSPVLPGRGLCWSTRESDDGSVMWFHAGMDPGVVALMALWPSEEIGVVTFANSHAPAQSMMSVVQRLCSMVS